MLEVQSLRKEYQGLVAVEGIEFSLKPGDVFGFIGSNGAGKTTTIRMIATLLEPTSGTAILDGIDVVKSPIEARRRIGYMPDFFGLYDDVKVAEYLDFFATLYEVPVNERPTVIDRALAQTNLAGKRNDFVQSLSRGMQQRLCLARCLVHDPLLFLLDEPASGLDPRARADLKDLIAGLGAAGKIVIVSSHILPELAGFCNTVGIIEMGQLIAFGPVDELVDKHRSERVVDIALISDVDACAAYLKLQENVSRVEHTEDGELHAVFAGTPDDEADLLKGLIDAGHRIVSYKEQHADLEEVFLNLTTGAVN